LAKSNKKNKGRRHGWADTVHDAAETAKDVTMLMVFLSPVWLHLFK
jgi:hypothetical protein